MNQYLNAPPRDSLPPEDRLDKLFTLEGEAGGDSGFYEMATSGSSVVYQVGPPPAGYEWHLRRMNLVAIDNNFNNANNYGGAPLPTGIALRVLDSEDAEVYNFMPNRRVQRIHDWTLWAGVDSTTEGSAGADPYMMRWTFARAGNDVILDGDEGHVLIFEIPDDLGSGGAGLDSHIAQVHGWRVKK
jgi:hypothetical protein